jgi:hypothetical protein
MDPIERLFSYWHVDPQEREIGPIAAALINAALTVERVLTPERFDEETITAALMGSLAGGLPWVAPLVGTRSQEQTEISWGQFSKTRTSQTGAMAEPDYGADFALALRLGEDEVRVALFQAKRPPDGRGTSIPIFKSIQDRSERFAQFLTLRRAAYDLLRNTHKSRRVSDLHWVHYVGYQGSGPVSVPMSTLTLHHKAANAGNMDLEPSLAAPFESLPLMNVFYAAVATPPGECTGWITLSAQQARDELPLLQPLMPVFTADERGGGRTAILEAAPVIAIAPPKSAPMPSPAGPSGKGPGP